MSETNMYTEKKFSKISNIVITLGGRIVNNKYLYYMLNFTWGIVTTIMGYLLLAVLLPFGRIKKHNKHLYLELLKPLKGGFSLGVITFTGSNPTEKMLNHEIGHSVQNAILGPFMLLLVSIPSVIRFWYRRYLYLNDSQAFDDYYDVWFEMSASCIGNNYDIYLKEKNEKRLFAYDLLSNDELNELRSTKKVKLALNRYDNALRKIALVKFAVVLGDFRDKNVPLSNDEIAFIGRCSTILNDELIRLTGIKEFYVKRVPSKKMSAGMNTNNMYDFEREFWDIDIIIEGYCD